MILSMTILYKEYLGLSALKSQPNQFDLLFFHLFTIYLYMITPRVVTARAFYVLKGALTSSLFN